ncbi:MAG: MerR family transcriptional regulator [Syntrophus sp. (in: bacteria)]|nr:MerR family transcriptional regulator [Deltaproteobacteria bacterium]
MDVSIPDKTYFRIGEVSSILGVESYVVRYWESEFKSVKPVRTRSDQRLYRRKDLDELLIIRDLLYKDHFTIKGAKNQLSRRGSITCQEGTVNQERQLLTAVKITLRQIREIIS